MWGMIVVIEEQFREIVEAKLKDKGWSRSELARQMGVRPQFVTDVLNARNSPGADVMERFLKALNLRPKLAAEEIEAES
jgi:ribosome-binding protein aMBF1 (putative translation factor)